MSTRPASGQPHRQSRRPRRLPRASHRGLHLVARALRVDRDVEHERQEAAAGTDISPWLDAVVSKPDIVVVGFQEIVPHAGQGARGGGREGDERVEAIIERRSTREAEGVREARRRPPPGGPADGDDAGEAAGGAWTSFDGEFEDGRRSGGGGGAATQLADPKRPRDPRRPLASLRSTACKQLVGLTSPCGPRRRRHRTRGRVRGDRVDGFQPGRGRCRLPRWATRAAPRFGRSQHPGTVRVLAPQRRESAGRREQALARLPRHREQAVVPGAPRGELRRRRDRALGSAKDARVRSGSADEHRRTAGRYGPGRIAGNPEAAGADQLVLSSGGRASWGGPRRR